MQQHLNSTKFSKDMAIVIDNISKEYRTGFWMKRYLAVDSLCLSVPKGETFGFVGPNGAGKTSTITILAGLQAPTKGNAYIHGISSQEPASKRALGFLPERPYFYTYLTAKELLRFYGGLCSLSGVSLEKRILELLERTNIMEFSDVPLGKYSKGMLQRVGLCQTLLHDPDVILLDEPMSGLDPVGRALVKEIIVEEKQKGKTVFFCSHVLSDVESICDRVAVVIKGKLRLLGTIRELVQEQEEMFRCVYRASVQCFPTEQVDTQGVRTTIISKNDLSSALLHLHQKNTEILGVSLVQKSLESVLVDEVRRDMQHAHTIDHKNMGVLA